MPTLFPYQIEGVEFLAARRSALLMDGCRMGKTAMVLSAAAKVGIDTPIIVLGPSISRGTWEAEAAVWRPDLKVIRIEHRGDFQFPRPGEMVVSSYELSPAAFNDTDIYPGTILVLDEAQRVSHLQASRTQRAEQLAFAVNRRGGRRYCLTATPIVSYPMELFVITGLLGANSLCWGGFAKFLELFDAHQSGFRGKIRWGIPGPEVSQRLARIALRRTRDEVAPQLLKNTVQVIPVQLSADARRLSDASLLAIRRRGISLWEADALSSARQQHTGIGSIAKTKAAIGICKLPYAIQMVEKYEQAGELLIVMSASRGVADAIAARPGWAGITGDTSPNRREDIQQQFRHGKLKGIAATIHAAGTAIDLSSAAHILFVDLTWDPGSVQQAAERIQGPRQKRPTTTMYLLSDHPLEQHLMSLSASKSACIRETMRKAS